MTSLVVAMRRDLLTSVVLCRPSSFTFATRFKYDVSLVCSLPRDVTVADTADDVAAGGLCGWTSASFAMLEKRMGAAIQDATLLSSSASRNAQT